MEAVKLAEDIYWVGGIDWDLRNFHGYLTQRGSTYNAYLIIDEKVTLIDTVKYYLFDEMMERISSVIDPAEIDYVISNHVEMDHSGGLPRLMESVSGAAVYTSTRGKAGLAGHYDTGGWQLEAVKTGDSLELGKRTLEFIQTPMVHWPDNMMTYLRDEKILFSNDSFGQHYATPERFDDQVPRDILMEEFQKYYANIVMPYGSQVQRELNTVEEKELDIEMIAPSHGLIWRENIGLIIDKYQRWSTGQTEGEALIVYDTMWKSTEKMAYALLNYFNSRGIKTRIKNLQTNHISGIIPYLLDADYICVGSPTLNNNMLPTVAAFLTYLKGLSFGEKKAVAFGSYGWGGQSVGQVADMLDDSGFEVVDQIRLQYIPDQEELQEALSNLGQVLDAG